MNILPRSLFILTATSTLLALTGCSTIVSGTKTPVTVNSSPSGASVSIDGQLRGTTPASLEIPSSKPHQVTIQLAGYQPYEVSLTQKGNGWIWGNIFFGGLIGVIVDASDGAVYTLVPSEINAQLVPAGRPVPPGRRSAARLRGNDVVNAFVVAKADPAWHKVGQMKRS